MVQKKYEDMVVDVDDFFTWTDGLKQSTTVHLQQGMDDKMAEIISENNMLAN